MNLDKLGLTTKKKEVNIQSLIEKIKQGKSILFTGAGFSCGAKNSLGLEPFGAKNLSHILSEKCNIPKNDNLMFTSDYFLSRNSPHELINLLKALKSKINQPIIRLLLIQLQVKTVIVNSKIKLKLSLSYCLYLMRIPTLDCQSYLKS